MNFTKRAYENGNDATKKGIILRLFRDATRPTLYAIQKDAIEDNLSFEDVQDMIAKLTEELPKIEKIKTVFDKYDIINQGERPNKPELTDEEVEELKEMLEG